MSSESSLLQSVGATAEGLAYCALVLDGDARLAFANATARTFFRLESGWPLLVLGSPAWASALGPRDPARLSVPLERAQLPEARALRGETFAGHLFYRAEREPTLAWVQSVPIWDAGEPEAHVVGALTLVSPLPTVCATCTADPAKLLAVLPSALPVIGDQRGGSAMQERMRRIDAHLAYARAALAH